jgi:hypothetical protein
MAGLRESPLLAGMAAYAFKCIQEPGMATLAIEAVRCTNELRACTWTMASADMAKAAEEATAAFQALLAARLSKVDEARAALEMSVSMGRLVSQ